MSNGIGFVSHVDFPSTVLIGVASEHAELIVELIVLVKALFLCGHLTCTNPRTLNAAESWWAVAERVLQRVPIELLTWYKNIALALGVAFHYARCALGRPLPFAFEALKSSIAKAVALNTHGLSTFSAAKLSADFAVPPAFACFHCKNSKVVCVVAGYRRACLRCFSNNSCCFFNFVRGLLCIVPR